MSTSDVVSQVSEAINAALSPYISENEELRESLADVKASLAYEDKTWQLLTGLQNGDRLEGLDLDEVKELSVKARTQVAANSLSKHASDLHGGFVWGQGVEISGTTRTPDAQGRPPATVRFFEDPINQENLFSGSAQRELQKARFTDGNVIMFCDTSKKKVYRIPISQICAVMTDPDHSEIVTAWCREWDHHLKNGKTEKKKAWVYTNRHSGVKAQNIKMGNESVPVLTNHIAVDLRANRQIGFSLGVPDILAGMHWATAYGEVLRYGQIVNESLAKVVYKVVNKTQKGASNVGVKMRNTGPGGVAAVGEGQDIQLVNSSQRSFDFAAARPLAAMAAAAWNLSNIDLLSDSSAAGSSYGAGNLLSDGVRNAMRGMQNEWGIFITEVFVAMGFERPSIHWEPMEKPDAYRMAQELTLYSVALSDEEYRAAVLDRLDLPGKPSEIPPTLKMRSAEPKSQQASPDQGKNTPAGGADSGSLNDQRSDVISNESVLSQMQREDFLKEMRDILAEMRSLKS